MRSDQRDKGLFWCLVVGSILYLLALPVAVVVAMMSPMASDSGLTTGAQLFIFTAMTFPVAIVLGPILAWIAYVSGWNRTGWALLLLPVAWPVALLAAMSV